MENKAATLTSKGQITIPKEIRDILQIDTGDTIIFEVDSGIQEEEETTIIIKKDKAYKICPVCEGNGVINEKTCFICDNTGKVPAHYHSIWSEIERLIKKANKYKLGIGVKNDDIITKIILMSSEYPQHYIDLAQDYLQMKLIEQCAPRSIQDNSKFMIPSDIELERIINLLKNNGAKEEVNGWFRYQRTV